jgi:hypothetical protein
MILSLRFLRIIAQHGNFSRRFDAECHPVFSDFRNDNIHVVPDPDCLADAAR